MTDQELVELGKSTRARLAQLQAQAETLKSQAEARKLQAEARKLQAEAANLRTRAWFYPLLVFIAFVGGAYALASWLLA